MPAYDDKAYYATRAKLLADCHRLSQAYTTTTRIGLPSATLKRDYDNAQKAYDAFMAKHERVSL